jgi:hypothetical protein
MVNTNNSSSWNVGLFVLPIRNKIARLRKKLISSSNSATRTDRSAHQRRRCKSAADGRAIGLVSKRVKSKSVIMDQEVQKEVVDMNETSVYWMNKEVRWK